VPLGVVALGVDGVGGVAGVEGVAGRGLRPGGRQALELSAFARRAARSSFALSDGEMRITAHVMAMESARIPAM
jgi:hypothetical protein